jgi:hypothetical protein
MLVLPNRETLLPHSGRPPVQMSQGTIG